MPITTEELDLLTVPTGSERLLMEMHNAAEREVEELRAEVERLREVLGELLGWADLMRVDYPEIRDSRALSWAREALDTK